MKASYKGRDVEIPAVESPFDEDESHLVEAAFYDEAATPGTNSIVPYRGVPLENQKGEGGKETKGERRDKKQEEEKKVAKKVEIEGDNKKRKSVEIDEGKKGIEAASIKRLERFIAPNGKICWRIL